MVVWYAFACVCVFLFSIDTTTSLAIPRSKHNVNEVKRLRVSPRLVPYCCVMLSFGFGQNRGAHGRTKNASGGGKERTGDAKEQGEHQQQQPAAREPMMQTNSDHGRVGR